MNTIYCEKLHFVNIIRHKNATFVMPSVFRIMQTDFSFVLQKLSPQGLTFGRIYDKFTPVRGCEKDTPSRGLLREKPVGARLCKFAVEDTTLEP